MMHPSLKSGLFFLTVLCALSMCSCNKKAPPALDRATFVDETSIKLPNDAEMVNSKSFSDSYATGYSIILRMPKSSEGILPGVGTTEDTKYLTNPHNSSHQLDLNAFSQAGIVIRDRNAPCKEYQLTTKTRGKGRARVYADGDAIYVLCKFAIPK